jgi:hypothetical protein
VGNKNAKMIIDIIINTAKFIFIKVNFDVA